VVDPYKIILRPVVTEKSHYLRQEGRRGRSENKINAYTFEVGMEANKNQIKEAVERLFSVRVVKVNTAYVKGKRRRLGRRRLAEGRTKDWKKAIIVLAPEHSIALY
jgi:large subunit ribosomal protein L23